MSLKHVSHGSATTRGPSPKLFRHCRRTEFEELGNGFFFFDDFIGGPTLASGVSQRPYISYQDTGVTISPIATEVGGVLRIAGNDADNDEGIISVGAGANCKISDTPGENLRVWFECRIRVGSVADNALPFFVGLGEEGLAATATLVDDTAVLKTTADFVGWRTLAANGDALECVHQVASTTPVTPGDATAIAASTWYKLGFYYDGEYLQYFLDGEEYLDLADRPKPSDTGFPDAEELTALIACKACTDMSEVTFDIDWLAFAAQLEW